MIPPTDPLKVALAKVPLLCATCRTRVPSLTIHVCDSPLLVPDYLALADMAKALGLTP